MIKIESLKKALGNKEIKELPSHTFPGCYPLYYVSTVCGNIYCSDCANQMIDNEYEDIISYGINYESTDLYCKCGKHIAPVYGLEEEEII